MLATPRTAIYHWLNFAKFCPNFSFQDPNFSTNPRPVIFSTLLIFFCFIILFRHASLSRPSCVIKQRSMFLILKSCHHPMIALHFTSLPFFIAKTHSLLFSCEYLQISKKVMSTPPNPRCTKSVKNVKNVKFLLYKTSLLLHSGVKIGFLPFLHILHLRCIMNFVSTLQKVI